MHFYFLQAGKPWLRLPGHSLACLTCSCFCVCMHGTESSTHNGHFPWCAALWLLTIPFQYPPCLLREENTCGIVCHCKRRCS